MKIQLTQSYWLSLEHDVRIQMADIFNMPRKGFVQVMDNRVISDGYDYESLGFVTIEKMQDFTESTSDNFVELILLTIDKIKQISYAKKDTKTEVKTTERSGESTTGKREKTKSTGKKRTVSNSPEGNQDNNGSKEPVSSVSGSVAASVQQPDVESTGL